MHDRRREHHGEDRQRRVSQRAAANRPDRNSGNQPFGARRVDQRSARHLRNQGYETGRRKHETNVDLRPFLRGEKNRDERPKAGLYVGNKKDEPIESAQTAARRRERRLDRIGSPGRGRSGSACVVAAMPTVIVAEAP
jgi:hypothetical protein